jgi:hypothetical protein
MSMKIALSGKFSCYELICDDDGLIRCHNLKDDTTQTLCTFDPTYLSIRFKSERYKNLRKWMDRKVRILYELNKSRRSSYSMTSGEKTRIINEFYSTLKTEVREFKLKDLE